MDLIPDKDPTLLRQILQWPAVDLLLSAPRSGFPANSKLKEVIAGRDLEIETLKEIDHQKR